MWSVWHISSLKNESPSAVFCIQRGLRGLGGIVPSSSSSSSDLFLFRCELSILCRSESNFPETAGWCWKRIETCMGSERPWSTILLKRHANPACLRIFANVPSFPMNSESVAYTERTRFSWHWFNIVCTGIESHVKLCRSSLRRSSILFLKR